MSNSNFTHGLPVLVNCKEAVEGNRYRFPRIVNAESCPTDAEKTKYSVSAKKIRQFITAKAIKKEEDKIIFTGHKTRKVGQKYKNNKKTYSFELPLNYKFN